MNDDRFIMLRNREQNARDMLRSMAAGPQTVATSKAPAMGAVLMSLSTVIVAINARFLKLRS